MAKNQPHSLAVGGLAALAVALGIGRFVYTPILPGMMADLGLTAGEAGLIASANYAGYLVGAIVAAMPMPASRRTILASTLIVSAATTLAMAGLSALWAIIAIRFVGGIASAGGMVLASGLVLQRSREQGDTGAAGLHFAGVGVGIVLSSLLVMIVRGAGLDWRVEWLISGLVSVLLAGMAIAKIDDKDPTTSAVKPAQARFSGGLLPLILAYGLFGVGYVVTATFLAAIIHGEPSLQAIEPVAWLVVGVSAMFSVAIWLKLAERWGVLAAFAVACVIEAIGVGASAGPVTQASMLFAALLLGGTFMGMVALGFLAARERVSGDPQPILAWMTASFGIGQIIGPLAAGVLHDRTGDFVLASLGAAMALILAAILALLSVVASKKAGTV
jgi:predicted MFS family arabinose efflux permease